MNYLLFIFLTTSQPGVLVPSQAFNLGFESKTTCNAVADIANGGGDVRAFCYPAREDMWNNDKYGYYHSNGVQTQAHIPVQVQEK